LDKFDVDAALIVKTKSYKRFGNTY